MNSFSVVMVTAFFLGIASAQPPPNFAEVRANYLAGKLQLAKRLLKEGVPNWAIMESVDIVLVAPDSIEAKEAGKLILSNPDHVGVWDFYQLTGVLLTQLEKEPSVAEQTELLRQALRKVYH